MAEASPERLDLTNRINRLQFAEYRTAGWFKAVTLGELRLPRYLDAAQAEVVDCYARNPADASLDRELIRLFLREWLACHHPESMSAYALEVSQFLPVDRAGALTAVETVISATLRDPRARIAGCLDWLKPVSSEEAADVPYPRLWSWFEELFGEGSRFYVHDSPGWSTRPPDLVRPRVIGLTADVIGMLWLE